MVDFYFNLSVIMALAHVTVYFSAFLWLVIRNAPFKIKIIGGNGEVE